MLFGQVFPSETSAVRVVALTGKKGQPPVLWDGPVTAETEEVIRQISGNKRIVAWLHQNGYVERRVATVDLQVQGYAGNKRIVSHTLPEYRFIVRSRRRRGPVGEEIVLRSFDMAERMIQLLMHLVEDRDTVIGRVVDRGLRSTGEQAAAPPPPSTGDALSQFLDQVPRITELAESFRKARRDRTEAD